MIGPLYSAEITDGAGAVILWFFDVPERELKDAVWAAFVVHSGRRSEDPRKQLRVNVWRAT